MCTSECHHFSLKHYREATYRNTLPTVVPWSINTGTKVQKIKDQCYGRDFTWHTPFFSSQYQHSKLFYQLILFTGSIPF